MYAVIVTKECHNNVFKYFTNCFIKVLNINTINIILIEKLIKKYILSTPFIKYFKI